MKKSGAPFNHSITSLFPVMLGPIAAAAMTADAAGELPKRIRLAKWGANKARGLGENGGDAEFVVNETTLKSLAANQVARGFDLVTMDFEHETHRGHANYKSGAVEVAGRGVVSVVEGEGVFLDVTKYTPAGLKFAANYPDVSGVFWTNKEGEVVLVSSVALTLHGAVEGAEFTEAATRALAASIVAAMAGPLADPKGAPRREPVPAGAPSLDTLLALGRELLGYTDDATAADVAQGFNELLRAKRAREEGREGAAPEGNPNPQTQSPPEKPNMKTTEEKLAELTGVVQGLADTLKPLAASIAEIQTTTAKDAHNKAVEAVISEGISAGKVIPASLKEQDASGRYVMTAGAAKEILACIPASVPVQRGALVIPGQGGGDSIGSVEREVMLACNITEEEWKKPGVIKPAFAPAPSSTVVS